jgi:hypothetical protein
VDIILVGYRPKLFRKKHTNFWPWNYLNDTFNGLGYDSSHQNPSSINFKKPHIFICWNEPDSLTLIEKYKPHKDSIIIQKLTSFDTSKESQRDWTDNPVNFYKSWHWPQYQKLYALENSGYQFYAFGAQSDWKSFPTKNEIVSKFQDHIFWIPWGTMTVPHKDIMRSQPITDHFKYDVGFVGSRWGTKYRGNITEWDTFLNPVIEGAENVALAGRGTPKGAVSVNEHIDILKSSRLCPIIHAASWKAEKGIMDRFWTVFSLGRFGVVDNEGILDFYNEDEVVLATDAEEYVDKSLYYMKNVDKQKPYIEAALSRIKSEYNQHTVWKNILEKIMAGK